MSDVKAAAARRSPGFRIAVCLLAATLFACSPPAQRGDGTPSSRSTSPVPARPGAPRPAEHVVRAGETLYGIARRYGVDARDLARWNGLGDGTLIRVGQRLRLSAPDGQRASPAMPSTPAPRWLWPTEGPVLRTFGATRQTQSGIHIGGRLGQPVVAAAPGQVVYAGNGLVGYGELLIIKHSESWLTAYGYNQELLVTEGQRVQGGQAIARMGEGPGRQPALHFEIRENGSPVDPGQFFRGR